MTWTRTQQNQAARRSVQEEKNTTGTLAQVLSEPLLDQAEGRTARRGTAAAQTTTQTPPGLPLEIPIHTATTPSNIMDLITSDTSTISEEGKTIVNTSIKAM
ncbi:hypothetical protein Pcinc_010968 [Petrolisthes cinctipes]|uniref:Uncharacterized protein n=1 Tax=Petrolisthes cinctipes TaxID=88211 RepID=A0AAE1KUX2_PETCI|nr:hypothetical protein Pcinc_010968 [Petrolisthes cinctipes]